MYVMFGDWHNCGNILNRPRGHVTAPVQKPISFKLSSSDSAEVLKHFLWTKWWRVNLLLKHVAPTGGILRWWPLERMETS